MSVKNFRALKSPNSPTTPASPGNSGVAGHNSSGSGGGSVGKIAGGLSYGSFQGSFHGASLLQLRSPEGTTNTASSFAADNDLQLLQPPVSGYDYLIKVAILGDAGVGKSTFLDAENYFDGKPGPIEGYWHSTLRQKSGKPVTVFEPRQQLSKTCPCIRMKTRDYKFDERTYRLVFWDCPGDKQEQQRTVHLAGGAVAVFYLFDLTSEASFTSIEDWLNLTAKPFGNAVRFLIGNKDNCMERPREVSKLRAEAFARSQGLIYFEIDAKSNIRCSSVFRTLFSKVVERAPRTMDPRLFREANVRPGTKTLADAEFRTKHRPFANAKNEHATFHLNWL
ncbi:Ras-related protein Rab-8 [Hondaea fermentalgiana]|uniref:Ras-related protein Rab-8 n=1 Tax=Hondaea fermentalgiana TaxID=2315210 RepID=A0A2R5GTV3_9STRA|nr:Ras-related protein Rab-8 [Hondaea fermentalgiana]|eukprot:GBG31821.1 Ras-related protein Rab-8 [Hondaea fermentalgiana]